MKFMLAKPSDDCYGSLVVFTNLLAQAFNNIGIGIEKAENVSDIINHVADCDAVLVFNGNMEIKCDHGNDVLFLILSIHLLLTLLLIIQGCI